MKRFFAFVFIFYSGISFSEEKSEIDLSFKTRLIGEGHTLRTDSVFGPGLRFTSFGEDRVRAEEEIRGKVGPFQLLATGRAVSQERQRGNGQVVVNELYTDFKLDRNHFTVGKKILSGDVGYGFRPIDVIQREQRLAILPPALVGVPNVTWERFSADQAFSVIYANPGHGERGDPKTDGSLSARYYGRFGKTDLHAIARASDRYKLETGAAVSSVQSDAVELHGSFLFIDRNENKSSATKSLAGLTWSFESGWSLVGEAWWDGTAPTAQDWKTLSDRAKAFQNIPPALAGLTRMFQLPGYARRNGLLHAGWTDPGGSGWSGYADLLRTFDDRGYTVTLAVGYEADKVRVDAGYRRLGGDTNAAYRLFPEKGLFFMGVSLAF